MNASRLTSDLPSHARVVMIMGASVSTLLVAHIIEVAMWAVGYASLHGVPKQTDAFYFAFVNYTTLGYGDILPVERWRLLGPVTAMCGVLMFGWSTAVIYDVLRNIAQKPHPPES
jgi:hypothetical protein